MALRKALQRGDKVVARALARFQPGLEAALAERRRVATRSQ